MPKKTQRPDIIVGAHYGDIEVVSIVSDRKYRVYNVRCQKCGYKSTCSGTVIYKYADLGCPNCREKKRVDQLIKQASDEHIEERYGDLTICGFDYKKWKGYKAHAVLIAKCICDCGKTIEIPWYRVYSGGAKSCGHDRKENLKKGTEKCQVGRVDGTKIYSLSKTIPKNSTTGITGVSYDRGTGKYRAYINLRRKQYHLGEYYSIDEAARARRLGEKIIWGGFLDSSLEDAPEEFVKEAKKIIKKLGLE